ncbi:MAG: hypothetical protein ACI9FO_000498 [Methylophagaceae bacterium]|jgi:hypothetical protein
MLVTFTTKAYADITMFGDVALSLLKMMGHSGTVPSAILASDVAEALTRLKSALDAKTEQQSAQNTQDDEPKVSMHNRALPLLSLLAAAAKQQSDVMWK